MPPPGAGRRDGPCSTPSDSAEFGAALRGQMPPAEPASYNPGQHACVGARHAMDMEPPEMEQVTIQMRETMRMWLEHPEDERRKERFAALQKLYHKMFLDLTAGRGP